MARRMNAEIAARAAEAVNEMIAARNSSLIEEMKRLGIDRRYFYHWQNLECCPNSVNLAKMAACGYDVIHILTGERGEKQKTT